MTGRRPPPFPLLGGPPRVAPAVSPKPAGAAKGANDGLRLALGRDGLGFELEAEATFAFLTVTAFRIALPREAAPLEVRGGLSSFSAGREARGVLAELEVRVPAVAFEAWARARGESVLGATTVRFTWGEQAASLVFARGGVDWGRATFTITADEGDIAVQLEDASGALGATSSRSLALSLMDHALRGFAEAGGARFVVKGSIRRVVRAVLGKAGVRAPRVEGRRWEAPDYQGGALVFTLAPPRSTPLPPTTARSIRAPAPALAEPPRPPRPASSPASAAEQALRRLVGTLAAMLEANAPVDRHALAVAIADAEAEGLCDPEAAARTRARFAPRVSTTDLRPPAFATTPHGEDTEEEAARDEARVEVLIQQLRADPARDDLADELAGRLLALGRGLELLSLLSARLDEASPARRRALLPQKRAVLAALRAEALHDGRHDDASMFEEALARDP